MSAPIQWHNLWLLTCIRLGICGAIWLLTGEPAEFERLDMSKFPLSRSVSFRPSEDKDDDLFAIFMGGKDIDFAKMVSNREELIKRIHELTGRSDFEFGKMSGITEYK